MPLGTITGKGEMMNSKYSQSKPSAKRKGYEPPIGSCDHLISTSLRDLTLQYKNLQSEQEGSDDSNEAKPDVTPLEP